MGGQTGKHLRKHHESQMFPQQCSLVCPGHYRMIFVRMMLGFRVRWYCYMMILTVIGCQMILLSIGWYC
jgi:hypothetical protein